MDSDRDPGRPAGVIGWGLLTLGGRAAEPNALVPRAALLEWQLTVWASRQAGVPWIAKFRALEETCR